MRRQKAKNRVVQSVRLQSLDGVKDVELGKASVENRARGNFHVTGKGSEADDSGFADVEARNKRFGF